MKTLLLLRHAKSSWKDPELADFDRPLNQRGRKAAEAMGKYIAKQQIEFDLVISSPAVRARQTIERVLRAAKLAPELRFDQRIYEASLLRLLEVIAEFEDDSKSVLLVGHNPGIEELASALSGQDGHMPTAALVRIRFNVKRWEKLAEKNGELDLFVKARDLE